MLCLCINSFRHIMLYVVFDPYVLVFVHAYPYPSFYAIAPSNCVCPPYHLPSTGSHYFRNIRATYYLSPLVQTTSTFSKNSLRQLMYVGAASICHAFFWTRVGSPLFFLIHFTFDNVAAQCDKMVYTLT